MVSGLRSSSSRFVRCASLSAQVDFETELYMANILNGMKSQIAAGAEFPHVFMSLHQGREAIEVAKAK